MTILARVIVSIVAAVFPTLIAASEPLVVYSARNEHLIRPLFERYTELTGEEINYITDKAGPLMARLRAESTGTPADLLITVDAGNLWQASQAGLLRPLESGLLKDRIPAHLRAPDGTWFGLSVRARTIVYSTERVEPGTLSTYQALAEEEWDDRLCLRTSKKVYNQSLVAMMIAEHGEEETEAVVAGWVENLATAPFSDDTAVMRAILAGQCDVGIVNSYYFGRLQAEWDEEQRDLPLALFWPKDGVHVNVSGAGVLRHADRPDAATRFLEWLASPEAQSLFASLNLEYPANPEVSPAPRVAAWGTFESELINVSRAGELQSEAVRLMDRVGYH